MTNQYTKVGEDRFRLRFLLHELERKRQIAKGA